MPLAQDITYISNHLLKTTQSVLQSHITQPTEPQPLMHSCPLQLGGHTASVHRLNVVENSKQLIKATHNLITQMQLKNMLFTHCNKLDGQSSKGNPPRETNHLQSDLSLMVCHRSEFIQDRPGVITFIV